MNKKTLTTMLASLLISATTIQAAEVIIEEIDVTPIVQAKKSYSEAISDYINNDYIEAKKGLSESEAWLKKTATSSEKSIKDEANKLAEETANLEGQVSKTSAATTAKFRALMAKSKALATRESDGLSSKYKNEKAKIAQENLILDAKLHLEYARISQYISGTKQDTLTELNKVSADFKAASAQADAKTKQELKSLDNEVTVLKKDASQKSDEVKAKYEALASKIEEL